MRYIQDIPKPESFIYLASPYSSDKPMERAIRHLMAEAATAYIIIAGFPTYSPIVHGHRMSIDHGIDDQNILWNSLNEPFIRTCSELWVLMIEGWQESKGVQWEVELAESLHTYIRYVYVAPDGQSILVMEDP